MRGITVFSMLKDIQLRVPTKCFVSDGDVKSGRRRGGAAVAVAVVVAVAMVWCGGNLGPRILLEIRESSYCHIVQNGELGYEVTYKQDRFMVDMRKCF